MKSTIVSRILFMSALMIPGGAAATGSDGGAGNG